MKPKIILTTSDNYHHLLPLTCYLFSKFWDKNALVEIVGYKKPIYELPSNFKFYSLGEQSKSNKCFSTDLRKYFIKQNDWFIWMFDDTFIREQVNKESLDLLYSEMYEPNAGRINLSGECVKQKHKYAYNIGEGGKYTVYENEQDAEYRLSTQISLWNKKYLLQYLTDNLSPWEFETQYSKNDGWKIIGMDKKQCPIKHNEGVKRTDIYKYDFTNIDQQTLGELQEIIVQNNIKWNK